MFRNTFRDLVFDWPKCKEKKKETLGRYNHKHVDMIVHTLQRVEVQNLGKVFSIHNQSIKLGMKLFLHVLYPFNQHQKKNGDCANTS